MQDELFIKRCIELAELAKGHTAPNPMVGAVLVHEGRIIGEGWHKEYGQAHAEVNCLESVKEEDRQFIPDSTMYVNLEPCAHHGKTPPCAARLVAEKVKRVVIANIDPFKQVAGRGIAILEQGGVEVETGILEQEGAWLNRRFFCFYTKKRPYIILKWAQTPEGFFAPEDKSRFQVTNADSQQLVHKWRTEEAAIMVGYNTALNDNPQLTARLWKGKQPLRIALDRQLSLPRAHKIFDDSAETWVINEHRAGKLGGAKLVEMQFGKNLLPMLMTELYEKNKLSLIVEGGAALLNSFIEVGLWDEARVFTGTNMLENGIAAPLLTDAVPAYETNISGDTLTVHMNKNNQFVYVNNMDL